MKHIYLYNLRSESSRRLTELLRAMHLDFKLHSIESPEQLPSSAVVFVDQPCSLSGDRRVVYFGFDPHQEAFCHLDPLEGKQALMEKLRALFDGHFRSTTIIGLMRLGTKSYYEPLFRYLSSFNKRVLLVDLAYRSVTATTPNFSKILYCMEGGTDYKTFIEIHESEGFDVIASFDALADFRLLETINLIEHLEQLTYEYIFVNLSEQPSNIVDQLLARGWWINALGKEEYPLPESTGFYRINGFEEMVLYHESH